MASAKAATSAPTQAPRTSRRRRKANTPRRARREGMGMDHDADPKWLAFYGTLQVSARILEIVGGRMERETGLQPAWFEVLAAVVLPDRALVDHGRAGGGHARGP